MLTSPRDSASRLRLHVAGLRDRPSRRRSASDPPPADMALIFGRLSSQRALRIFAELVSSSRRDDLVARRTTAASGAPSALRDHAHQRADAVVETDRIVERILAAAVLRLVERVLDLDERRRERRRRARVNSFCCAAGIFFSRSASSAFTRRISFTASFASENRSRICSARRDCSCQSASVALMRGSGSTLNVSVPTGCAADGHAHLVRARRHERTRDVRPPRESFPGSSTRRDSACSTGRCSRLAYSATRGGGGGPKNPSVGRRLRGAARGASRPCSM